VLRLSGPTPHGTLLTPGAAEALVVKAYRHARTQNVAGGEALARLEAGLTL